MKNANDFSLAISENYLDIAEKTFQEKFYTSC
jgi:hypothetical protein